MHFSYLRTRINRTTPGKSEIQERVFSANRAYFANKVYLQRFTSKESEIKVYKTRAREVINAEAEQLKILERIIVRIILPPIRTSTKETSNRMNYEMLGEL